MESIVVLFVVKYWRDQIVTVGSYVIITMVSSYLAPDCGNLVQILENLSLIHI